MTQINRHSDSIPRHCSRCHLPLEDAASREHGKGPICRAKDNAIFAKQIPADLSMASLMMMSLSADNFHQEISNQFLNVKDLYFKKVENLTNRQEGNVNFVLSGADFRKIVDWFDFALSYPCSNGIREKVIKLIEYLGYQALAGILRGDVCMSPAKLYIANNKVYLEAKSSKQGFLTMKRNIPGIITPRYRGDKTPYQCSLTHIQKFVEIANRYWPFLEATEDVTKALESIQTENTTLGTSDGTKPVIKVINNVGWFSIQMPWNGTKEEMYGMINRFKEIDYRDRKYNPEDKSWSFRTCYKNQVFEIVKNKYEIQEDLE